MKKLIKFFTITIFAFCMLPCFQMCSDNSILKRQYQNEIIVDSTLSTETLKFKNDSLERLTQEKRNLELERVRKQWTLNAYELGFSGFREFEIEDFEDWTLYPTLCFTFFIISSIFVSYFALKEHFTKVYKLSILNLAFMLFAMLIFIVKEGIDIFNYIRYGYYILLSNILVLIILSKTYVTRNSH